MKTISFFATIILFANLSIAYGDNSTTVTKREGHSAEHAVNQFKKADPGIEKFFDNSYAYIIYPTVGKGAVGIGGAYGKGYVYTKGLLGYSLVGISTLQQISIGLQLGGQSYSEIVFFQTEADFNKLKAGRVELSAQASAVALKSGASKNAAYNNGMLTFIRAEKGLMGELSIGGQQLSFEPAVKR